MTTATEALLYTHPDCEYSAALKAELDQAGAQYREINLAEEPDYWAEVERLSGGERITPVMVEGELVTVGFHGVG